MSLPTIVVYSKSNNQSVLRVLDKDEAVDLTDTTKIELRLDTGVTLSSTDYPGQISWSTGTEPKGLIYLKLGSLFFSSRTHTVELMVFNPDNTLGLFWGFFRIRAIEQSTQVT